MQLKDFEIYTGRNFTVEENDALMLKHIAPELLTAENDCLERRWFDYRMMHPTSATLLFDHVYKDEYRVAYRRDIDRDKARYAKTFKIDSLFARAPQEITSMWKARQTADLLGCPYDVFVATGMSWSRQNGWPSYPRPAQLYSEDVLEAIMAYWLDYSASVFVRPLRLLELGPQGDDSPWKSAYQLWLAETLSSRPGPLRFRLASAIRMTEDLDETFARQYFGDKQVNEALACFSL